MKVYIIVSNHEKNYRVIFPMKLKKAHELFSNARECKGTDVYIALDYDDEGRPINTICRALDSIVDI